MLLSVRTRMARSYPPGPHSRGRILSDRTNIESWLRPALPELVDEVIAAVQAAVPAYRVLDRNVRPGVPQALDGFVALSKTGASTPLPGPEADLPFGPGEARNGRPPDPPLRAAPVG